MPIFPYQKRVMLTNVYMQFFKLILLFLAVMAAPALLFGQTSADKKYRCQNAKIDFTSEAQLELIKASSSSGLGVIDPVSNQFAFSIDIKSFQGFNSPLQREHFNEKYMESEIFPKAIFRGKIIEEVDLNQNGTYEIRAKGDLDIHGVKQTRIIKATVLIQNGVAKVAAKFTVPLSDHNIAIPTLVSQKIASQILVQLDAAMTLR